MKELLLLSLFNAGLLYPFQYGQFLHPAQEWLQMYSPAWVPRKILFDCLFCTCFWWLSVPESLVLFYLSRSLWYLIYPLAISTLTVFFFPK